MQASAGLWYKPVAKALTTVSGNYYRVWISKLFISIVGRP